MKYTPIGKQLTMVFLVEVIGPFVLLLYINKFNEKGQGNSDIIQLADDKGFRCFKKNIDHAEKRYWKY